LPRHEGEETAAERAERSAIVATRQAIAAQREGFGSVEDVGNHIVGGVLMGFGGVTSLGCTIGQGLTRISTLAVGSFLAFGAIIAGCVAAVHYQVWRLEKMA
jgi:uncharacterized protein